MNFWKNSDIRPVGLASDLWTTKVSGVQYASAAYRQRLAQTGIVPSMSRKGNGYDNAMMESFWKHSET